MRASLVPVPILVVFSLLAAPAASSPPADAFCVVLIAPSPDFSRITISVDQETSLQERADLWPSVDLDGNGVVSAVEKEAFRWAQTTLHANQSDLGPHAIVLRPDAPYTKAPIQRPVYATTWRQVGHVFHKQAYQLPDKLTQTSELETQEIREFGFELEAGRSSRIILSGGRNVTAYGNLSAAPSYTDLPKPVIEYVVIRAPEDWLVERVEGHSYNGSFVVAPGKQEIDLPGFDTERPYNISFLNPGLDKKLGDIGSPGPGVAALLVGVIAAAWAVRFGRTRA
ncbi:MAG: hypothetical protein HYT80_02985 [Euryarchaeota archaeon]|nr:hypothetical protein [Euryarchaeota archaeon]